MEYKKKVLKYVFSNLTTVLWSTFLLIGGVVFLTYYYSIGYMPKLDLASSVTLVATASITALILTIAFAFAFILPGIYWSQVIDSNSKLKQLWHNGSKKSFLKLLVWFGLPIIGIYLTIVLFQVTKNYSILILFWIPIFLYIIYVISKVNLSCWEFFKEYLFYWLNTIVCFLISSLSLILFILIALNSAEKGFTLFVYVIVSGLFLVFSNFMIILKPDYIYPIFWYFGLGTAALLMVILAFNGYSLIPSLVMKQFQFGNINNSFIVLKEEGCHIVDEYKQPAPQEVNKNQAVNSKTTPKINIKNELCIVTDLTDGHISR